MNKYKFLNYTGKEKLEVNYSKDEIKNISNHKDYKDFSSKDYKDFLKMFISEDLNYSGFDFQNLD